MSTLDLLRRLYTNGTDVTIADDGTVQLTGHRPPDNLLTELRDHKAEVLAELRKQRHGEQDKDFDSVVLRRYVVPTSCLAHRACSRLGPCSRWLMRRRCNPFEQDGKEGEAA